MSNESIETFSSDGTYAICYKDGYWYAHTYEESHTNNKYVCEPKNRYISFGASLYDIMKACLVMGKSNISLVLAYYNGDHIKEHTRISLNDLVTFSGNYVASSALRAYWLCYEKVVELFENNKVSLIANQLKLKKEIKQVKRYFEENKYMINEYNDLQMSLVDSKPSIISEVYDCITTLNTALRKCNRLNKTIQKSNSNRNIQVLFELDISFYNFKLKNYVLQSEIQNYCGITSSKLYCTLHSAICRKEVPQYLFNSDDKTNSYYINAYDPTWIYRGDVIIEDTTVSTC